MPKAKNRARHKARRQRREAKGWRRTQRTTSHFLSQEEVPVTKEAPDKGSLLR